MSSVNPFDRRGDPEPEPDPLTGLPPPEVAEGEAVAFPDPPKRVADVWTAEGDYDAERADLIAEQTKEWPAEQRAAMLVSLRAAAARAAIRSKYTSPASIALECDTAFKLTPALRIIDTAIETVLKSVKPINLMITMPPQEGKSTEAAVWTPIRALQHDANTAVALATYAQSLAEAHSRVIRDIINTHGSGLVDNLTGLAVTDRLGLKLAKDANRVSSWGIEGAAGGFVAVGVGGSLTGRKADLMIIDDPFKNMMEADSVTWRDKIHTWFSTVALTRLSPSASVILIQTRWHPDDLAGKILAGERLLPRDERSWRHINIPAISEVGITDSLKRPPGEPMISARDKPEAKRNFPATRRKVGERTWYAMYQGSPYSLAGGIFQKAWFEPHLEQPPTFPVASVVGVDPADSGEGDEAGIIGGMLMQDGRAALTHDRSGQYTADQWSKQAVYLALEIGAREIAVEGYMAGKTYTNNVRKAYQSIHREAADKARAGAALTPVEQRALPDTMPFLVTQWRGPTKADAVARSGGLSQALETGRCRTVETSLIIFETQAVEWQPGQHQPDRVAAGVICYDRLAALGGGQMTITAPGTPPPTGPPDWMRRTLPG